MATAVSGSSDDNSSQSWRWPRWAQWDLSEMVHFWQIVSTPGTILGIVCECPKDGGWPSWGWWVTVLGMVGDHPFYGGWPTLGWWVTAMGRLGDCPWDCGWPSLLWCVTVQGMVCDHPCYGGWTFHPLLNHSPECGIAQLSLPLFVSSSESSAWRRQTAMPMPVPILLLDCPNCLSKLCHKWYCQM